MLLLLAAECSAECLDGDYAACRTALQAALFNSTTLPSREPDYILANGGPQVEHSGRKYVMSGLPGPGNGTGVGACAWENNLTALVWTIRSKLRATFMRSIRETRCSWRCSSSGGDGAERSRPMTLCGCLLTTCSFSETLNRR